MGLRDDMEYGQYRRERVVMEMSNSGRKWISSIDGYAIEAMDMCDEALKCQLDSVAEQRIHDFRLALEEAMKILRGDE